MDGVIVGGWGWVVAAYASAGAALVLYVCSLFVRRRRAEANAPTKDPSHEQGTDEADP